jgi:hypothetical protein
MLSHSTYLLQSNERYITINYLSIFILNFGNTKIFYMQMYFGSIYIYTQYIHMYIYIYTQYYIYNIVFKVK